MLNELWPFSVLPTLFYTWQYYDMIERVANQKTAFTRCTRVLRAFFILIAGIGSVALTLTYEDFLAQAYYFVIYVDYEDADHFLNKANRILAIVGAFVMICILISVTLLGGTIYWARQLMFRNELQTGSLNLPFITLHIGLLFV
jgi:hypothetical protein